METGNLNPSGKVPGVVLIGVSVTAVLGMSHHPELSGSGALDLVSSAGAIARQSSISHGALIATALVQWIALYEAGRQAYLAGWSHRAAVAAWGAGTAAFIGAAMISGFIAPDIGLLAAQEVLTADTAADQMRVAYVVNQRLSQLGVVLCATAIGLLSVGVIRASGFARGLAVCGITIAVAGAIAVAVGYLELDRRGMTMAVLVMSAWLAGFGALLVAGRRPQ